MSEMNIVMPLPEALKGRNVVEQVKEKKNSYVCERVEYREGEGIFVHYKGCLHPQKGFPFPQAIWSINTIKRGFIVLLKALPLAILFKKTRKRLFDAFAMQSIWVLEGVSLDEKYWCACARGVYQFSESFLGNKVLAEAGRAIIEYDDAYRYRLQDLMSETSKDLMLKQPIKELKKIARLIRERDSQVPDKLIGFVNIFVYALLIPSVRRKFKKAIEATCFPLLQYDEADKYYCMNRIGYNFMGKTFEERQEEYIKLHNGVMPTIIQIS